MGVVPEWDLSLLGTLGGALGDATRFSIYKHVVMSPEPISAGEAARQFGLHRTVARSHLEKLTEAGLVKVGTRRNPRGGRPAKVYSASDERIEIQLPPRRYETLSSMLIRLASKLNGRSAELAAEVGYQFGCEAAAGLRGGQHLPGGQLNLESIIAFLGERGCKPKVIVGTDGTLAVEVQNCLYLELARDNPEVVCGLSTGMLCGLLDADPAGHRQTSSIVAGDDTCVHEWRRMA
jgi:predicted ArsR family transcriptional regulator